jgi:hypothetical protein
LSKTEDTTPAITKNEAVFNSPQKDYEKRINLINEIKTQYEEKQKTLKGSIVSIWFFNGQAGAIGYEQGKKIAFAKISKFHDDVRSGKITMQEAGSIIRNDASLAQIDTAYKDNAYYAFQAESNESITYDPSFDKILRQLKSGETSAVYLGQDSDNATNKKIDAIYMFGQSESTSNVSTQTISFEDWIASQKKQYEITYY